MNRQEMFDKVWDHFVTKGKPLSVSAKGSCFYRGPKGERCAFGVLIPDRLYDPNMDAFGGVRASSLLRWYPDVAEYLDAEVSYEEATGDMLFIDDLQTAHDRVAKGDADWLEAGIEGSLRELADRYDLVVPA